MSATLTHNHDTWPTRDARRTQAYSATSLPLRILATTVLSFAPAQLVAPATDLCADRVAEPGCP